MFKKMLFASAILLLPTFAQAEKGPTRFEDMPKGHYALDENHASLTWKVSHLGLSKYTARFTKIDADLYLDPSDATKSKLVAVIDPTSVRTDYPHPYKTDFDDELATSGKWFDADNYPEIRFVSTKIKRIGKDRGRVYGNLTFLGITKPVALDVVFNTAYESAPISNESVIGFSATTTIKRSDWGLDTYVPMVGDDVNLYIEVEFKKD